MEYTCRPVDCDTKQPFPTYLPGRVSDTIVSDHVETGWGLTSYSVPAGGLNQQLQQAGAGYDGGNATCFTMAGQVGPHKLLLHSTLPNSALYLPLCACVTFWAVKRPESGFPVCNLISSGFILPVQPASQST